MANEFNKQSIIVEIGAATAMTAGPAGPLIEFTFTMATPEIDRD
ncbi:hypothetical protein BH10PSE14_BH10PSE14_43400 [soil metagenome]